MLEIGSLNVFHGPIQAVHGISFKVPAGQCVSLLGPNGAGKTSTISAISGVAKATGQLRFAGEEMVGRSVEWRVGKGLSVVPEGRRVFSNLTVEENLRLGGAIRKDRKKVVDDVAHWLDTFPVLGQRRRQMAGTLSGGEQQMLAIARALMTQPKILLLDEPSLGLAPRIVAQIFTMIRALKDQGMTILLVEQNATQALRLSDYAYLLNNGRIVTQGTAETIGQSGELMAELTGVA